MLKDSFDRVESKLRENPMYPAKLRKADVAIRVEVSSDGLEVRIASCDQLRRKGGQLSREMFAPALAQAGVEVEPDEEAIAQACERVARGLDAGGIVIARGIPPQDGRDGQFEFAPETGVPATLPPAEISQDAWQRETTASVVAGGLIGRIVPPDKGVPGRSVCGDLIPARGGRPFRVIPGANVSVSEDGLEFYAKSTGAVILSQNVLSVVVAFQVPGDVDFVRGDVRVRHASVVVQGSVRNGLTVTSGGGLSVAESVENCFIEAAGDVLVRRGIVMNGTGYVKSGGSVFCHAAENAVIEAIGDVVVDDEISNCDVRAHGKIVAIKGKGRIQGGVVRCDGGAEANQIGSSCGIATRVVVGLESEEHEALLFEQAELENTLRRLRTFIEGDGSSTVLKRAALEEGGSVAELLRTATAARRRLDDVSTALTAQESDLKRSRRASIKVREVVYPGTVLMIAGSSFQVREPIRKAAFYYDPQSDSVKFRI